MADAAYRPVDCTFHDHLEAYAIRRAPVRVSWRDGDAVREADTTIDDVFAADGADWVRLASGDVVRADRLVGVATASR